jgi:hypothetical protein
MRHVTILAAMIVACLVCSSTASAYTVTRSAARAGAFLSVHDYATSHEQEGEVTTRVKVRSCTRFGPRLFICLGQWDWELMPGYEYEHGNTVNPCFAKVRVGVWSGRLRRSRPYDIRCFG